MKLRDQTVWRVKRNEEADDILKGKYGTISQYKGGDLDILVTSMIVAGRIERQGWKAKNHYDDGALFVRPFADLNVAAKFLRCPRKRHMSPESRQKATERLAVMRSLAKKPQSKHSSDTQNPEKVIIHPESAESASYAAKEIKK